MVLSSKLCHVTSVLRTSHEMAILRIAFLAEGLQWYVRPTLCINSSIGKWPAQLLTPRKIIISKVCVIQKERWMCGYDNDWLRSFILWLVWGIIWFVDNPALNPKHRCSLHILIFSVAVLPQIMDKNLTLDMWFPICVRQDCTDWYKMLVLTNVYLL